MDDLPVLRINAYVVLRTVAERKKNDAHHHIEGSVKTMLPVVHLFLQERSVSIAAGNFATLQTPAQRFTVRQKGCKKYLMHALYIGH